jgi:Calx-beta domain/FG-GAP-like repeat
MWLSTLRRLSANTKTHKARRCPRALPPMQSLEERIVPSFLAPVTVADAYHDVVSADFNNDGSADLAAFQLGGGGIQVRLGNGDGTFDAGRTSPALASGFLDVGDFNRDGRVDTVVVQGNTVDVLLGRGDGTFAAVGRFTLPTATGANGSTVTPSAVGLRVGDLNNDGNPDLVVMGTSPGVGLYKIPYLHQQVFLGVGDGTFGAGITSGGGGGTLGDVELADFNGDGRLDVLTNYSALFNTAVDLRLGNGDGTFANGFFLSYTGAAGGLATGDFNADGNLDFAKTHAATGTTSVNVFLGNGDGTFQDRRSYLAGLRPVSIVAADLNRDGTLDLVAANRDDATISALLGNGDGTFQQAANFPAGPNPSGIAAADFNSDGYVDVAVAVVNANPSGISLLVNDGVWNGDPPPPALPVLTIGNATVDEGNSGSVAASFAVTLSQPSNGTITVQYSTSNGSAIAGSDYTAASGTLTFAPGETGKTIAISVLGDTVVEPDETFFVNLSSPDGATLADGRGDGTIVNDDAAVSTLSISDVTKKEGRKGSTSFTFTVTLSAPSTQTVSVHFATADGTAMISDNDYSSKSGTLTFQPGQTSKTITISVRGDKKVEADETFFVNLSSAQNALLADGQGVGTIVNDDGGLLALHAAFSDPDVMDAVLTGRKRK